MYTQPATCHCWLPKVGVLVLRVDKDNEPLASNACTLSLSTHSTRSVMLRTVGPSEQLARNFLLWQVEQRSGVGEVYEGQAVRSRRPKGTVPLLLLLLDRRDSSLVDDDRNASKKSLFTRACRLFVIPTTALNCTRRSTSLGMRGLLCIFFFFLGRGIGGCDQHFLHCTRGLTLWWPSLQP